MSVGFETHSSLLTFYNYSYIFTTMHNKDYAWFRCAFTTTKPHHFDNFMPVIIVIDPLSCGSFLRYLALKKAKNEVI